MYFKKKIISDFLYTWTSLYKSIFLFFFPNLSKLLQGRIIYQDFPKVNQILLCEGLGQVKIGKKCTFGYFLGGFRRGGSIELQARYKKSIIKIGNNVSTNNNIMLCAANYIEIGNDSLIGQYVTIMDHEAHGLPPSERRKIGEIGEVVLEENVWIGNNVIILKNTRIGKNSVIAAGAVVSGVFPENVIIGGIPAKIIKSL